MANAGSGFDPLPPGDYDVEIVKSEAKQSSSGKTMFAVQMKVLNGPNANRVVWNQFVVSPENPNALSYFFQHMAILGLDAQFFAANPPEATVASALVGRRCTVTLDQRTWQGTIRNNVKSLKKLAGVPAAPAAPAAAPAAPAPAPAAPAAAPAPAPVPEPPATPQPPAAAEAQPDAAAPSAPSVPF